MWSGPERIRALLWKVAINGLLTNESWFLRHLTLDKSCHLCGNDTKSVDHILHFCGVARVNFFLQDTKDWLLTNLNTDISVYGSTWACTFVVAIDKIWCVRNKFILESHSRQPMEIAIQTRHQSGGSRVEH
ncbi:putative ribonuclease H protein [Glycine soja]